MKSIVDFINEKQKYLIKGHTIKQLNTTIKSANDIIELLKPLEKEKYIKILSDSIIENSIKYTVSIAIHSEWDDEYGSISYYHTKYKWIFIFEPDGDTIEFKTFEEFSDWIINADW